MLIAQISNQLKHGCYFVTPTIRNWYYIFDRHNRWKILAESLKYCQKNKGLEIFAYVFMLNHLHLIVRSQNVSGFLRDFKTHTSKQLKNNLSEHEPEVLKLFMDGDGVYKFWKEDNKPKLIETEWFLLQKMKYIHESPVSKGYVEKCEYWKWSSANPESEIKIASVR